ncbi:hypothetical protein HDE_06468 [Halotydeus destructor]|nr:hypothetical protein HDE_06468 [Halotydeus destructor]
MGLCSCCRNGEEEEESKPGDGGVCSLFFRTVIFLFCGFLFACHSFLLVDRYLAHPTTIRTLLNDTDTVTLPGLTVCFPVRFEGNQINSANEVFKMNFNNGDPGSVKCNLMKTPVSMEHTADHGFAPSLSQMACEDIASPVESINYGYGQKCRTYFSQQKANNPLDFMVRKRNTIVGGNGGDIVDLEIEFPADLPINVQSGQQAASAAAASSASSSASSSANSHSTYHNGYLESPSALLMLHSPFEMPDWSEKVSKIKPSMEYVISFNKITEKRAEGPFGKCSWYDDTSSAIRSNYDCVDMCLLNLFRQGCRCLPANMNVRRELLYSGDRFCDDKRCLPLVSSESATCKQLPQCMPNCVQETYQFTSEVTPMVSQLYQQQQQQQASNIYFNNRRPVASLVANAVTKAFITLRRSSSPDLVYEHSPAIDYREFIFQLATLASVWLGVSVFGLVWRPFWFIGKSLARCCCLGKG